MLTDCRERFRGAPRGRCAVASYGPAAGGPPPARLRHPPPRKVDHGSHAEFASPRRRPDGRRHGPAVAANPRRPAHDARGSGRAAPERPRVPRHAGAQRDAGARLLLRGAPGRRRHHPERPARGHQRRPAPRPDPGPVAARPQGRAARRQPRHRRDQRAGRIPGSVEEPEGLQSRRLSGSRLRLHRAREARGPRLPHRRGPRHAAARCLGREGGIQPRTVPRHPLRQVVHHRHDVGRLPPAAPRPRRDRRRGPVPARAHGHRAPPHRGPRIRSAAAHDRGRLRRRPRTGGRPRPAHQRLVRRALPHRQRRRRRGRQLAGDAARHPRLDLAACRAGLPGGLPPGSAEVGRHRTRPRRRAPPARRRLARHRQRHARNRTRTAG